MKDAPQIGDFIRPVGNYGYCLEAFKITKYRTGKQITYRRHGLVDGQPFDDGHVSSGFFLNRLVATSDGVWKEPAFNGYKSVYYRIISRRQPLQGQQSLFVECAA